MENTFKAKQLRHTHAKYCASDFEWTWSYTTCCNSIILLKQLDMMIQIQYFQF